MSYVWSFDKFKMSQMMRMLHHILPMMRSKRTGQKVEEVDGMVVNMKNPTLQAKMGAMLC